MAAEAAALTRLAAEELARAAGGIGGVQSGVASRTFAALGPVGRPVQVMHEAITAATFRLVADALRATGLGARFAPNVPVSTTPRGATLVAIVNGLIGDVLAEQGSPLAAPLAIRVDGEPVAASDAAPPNASPRVVVFVHGLFESEYSWRQGYGSRLMEDGGWTPLYVRYNSGLPVADNGAQLAALLDELVDAWPVEVEQLALVGHSMGGLVSRHACARGGAWTGRLTHVISLGSPYGGSPVARGVDLLARALGRLPESRPFGAFFDRRSAGIRDLEAGCAEVEPIEGPRHCFVSAGRDLLVLRSSASGPGESFHLPGAGHFALLDHPEVYERLKSWLRTPIPA